MEDDLNALRRLLQRNKNQHRRTKYFQLIRGAERKLRRWSSIELAAEESAVAELEKAVDLLRKGAACLTQLIAKEFFLPFAVVLLALVSSIHKQASLEVKEARRKLVDSQDLGSVVERPRQRKRIAPPTSGSLGLYSAEESAAIIVSKAVQKIIEVDATNSLTGGAADASVVAESKVKLELRPEVQFIRKMKKVQQLKPPKRDRDAIDDIFSAFD